VRSERRAAATAALVALALACREPPPPQGAAPERFQGVRRQDAEPAAAANAFCERTWPAGGEGARRWSAPPLRPLGPAAAGAAPARGGWTWVNLWATWCTPCVEEMGLLGRWREALAREGVPVGFELLSIDEPEQEAALAAWGTRGLPGPIRWLRSPQDLPALLDALGVDRDAMIPIHALVDAAGFVRCVRVGAIHEQDYAAVKRLLGR
jgi:thiol-disulfide isomerase/thioredoxin